jgi:polysaccharide pyruvyl transferase WcaK-like protein
MAMRYHNIICALKLAKPTIAIGYAAKTKAIMADAGLSEFCQPADALDVSVLIERFNELNSRSAELRRTIAERNVLNARLLDGQFRRLSAVLFPAGVPTQAGGQVDSHPESAGRRAAV